MSEWLIELEITKGQDVGSFVDGGKRSYTVVKKKGEFSTFGFLADGQKGYGDVEITARSGGITVVKGFKVVAPAPRVHIVPPWWWYGQPIKLSFDNLPILEFGETHTPGPGQKFEPVITWEPDDIIRTAGYYGQFDETMSISVKVKAENPGGTAQDSLKLTLTTECIKVNFDPTELSPGDTASLSFQRKKSDGTLEDLPSGSYTFSVMIVGGEDSSKGLFVTEEEEPEGGTTLLYASAPILYIAPPSIPDTSMKVQVIAAAWEVIWGRVVDVPRKGRVAIGLQSPDDKREQTLKQAAADSIVKRMRANVAETALKAISLSTWCPISQVVVKKSVNIKLVVGTTSLPPLGDDGNKDNPNYNRDGPDKRIKIKDSSKVRKTTATVTVTDADNKPVKDYSFTIKALVRANSGGHDHSENRATGRFVTEAKETLVAVQAKTESDGKKEFTYLSSGIGGIDSIFVKGTTDKDTASAVIVLKLGDLEELTDGNHYDLVGEYGETDVTSRHRRNHYGKVDLIKKVKALADTIYADKKYKLRINDMSLQLGGPFDISNNWDTPHQKHRQGVSADIDDYVVKENGKSISITKDQLSFWLKKVSKDASIGDEGDHFHLTVK